MCCWQAGGGRLAPAQPSLLREPLAFQPVCIEGEQGHRAGERAEANVQAARDAIKSRPVARLTGHRVLVPRGRA
jgi:hypothetical protein